jgi:dephospho-CoA kinase
MIVLGLTGSIAMGKTTAARMFRRAGLAVHDADATVHRLLGPGGGAVTLVERSFPGVVRDGAVDRPALAARVFNDAAALRRLERILHPLVRRDRARFLGQARRRGAALVVFDIPLLFETSAERECDAVAVVIAPAFLQRQRLLKRPGMTDSRIKAIRARQMADHEKRRRADFVIPSGLGYGPAQAAIAGIVAALRSPCWQGRRRRRRAA